MEKNTRLGVSGKLRIVSIAKNRKPRYNNGIIWVHMVSNGVIMVDLRYKKDALYEQLKADILGGKYAPHAKIPREQDFARQLGVAKVTLRSALSKLEEEGLVARMRAKGTFVLPQKPQRPTRQGTILVITEILGKLESPNNYILPGVVAAVTSADHPLETCHRHYIEHLSDDELTAVLKRKNVRGIIALMAHFNGDEPIIGQLRRTELPVVLPHGHKHDTRLTGFASIIVTEEDAWRDAVRHLCECGHERVATISLDNRYRGFTLREHLGLLAKYGAEADEALVGSAPYDKDAVAVVIRKWMDLPHPPSAILCYSDFLAIHVYEALKALALRIPEDVAVMGCCGYPGGSYLNPSLSTVDYEYATLGEMSVDMILSADKWFPAKRATAVPRIYKKHVLVARQSTDIMRLEKDLDFSFSRQKITSFQDSGTGKSRRSRLSSAEVKL